MNKIRKRRIEFFAFLFIVLAIILFAQNKDASAATKRLSAITAVYTGETLCVGDAIPLDKLTVMGMYSDGSYEKIKDFSLSTYVISNNGANTIEIFSEGVRGTFTVTGKKVLLISAVYKYSTATIGEKIDRDALTVKVRYTDGSEETVTDYTLSGTYVAYLGRNEFTVVYGSVQTKFTVTGKVEKKPKSITASYNGAPVIVGNAPKREDFYVSIAYTDYTVEKITAFELLPSIVQKEGENKIVVSYAGLSTEVTVIGRAKKVASIKAEYIGLPVVIGNTVKQEDIKVTATYNDGTKDTTTAFTLSTSVIYKIGDNMLSVFCEGSRAYINVRGVEAEIIDYSDGVSETIWDNGLSSIVQIAVNAKVDAKNISVKTVEAKNVEKAVLRSIKTDRYMAFEVSFDDTNLDSYLPMTMKVSVPAGVSQEMFGVFYTPNQKTIMAQMNGEFLKDGMYEFKMFQPGTYIIADCTQQIYVESIKFEENELALRVGRSYSLDPEVLPHAATDKTIAYKSSRSTIVSVSEQGTLKAHKVGTAIITAEAKDGSGKKVKIRVTVTEKKPGKEKSE